MGTTMEEVRNYITEKSMWRIKECLLDLRCELMAVGVPLEAIEINNWPKFDKDDVHVKVWDGKDHIKGTGKPGSTYMTPLDIIALVKRRQILMRKF